MKRILASCLFIFGLVAMVHAQTTTSAAPAPGTSAQPQVSAPAPAPVSIKFTETTHDYGTIPQGIPASCEFSFSNVSKTPVSIAKVQKSCGCTEPKFSQEPVLPGGKSTITATYNAAGIGPFNKTLTVTTSNNETYMLTIKGTVETKKE